ncbi:MAG: copper resistance protein CopC [Azospirillaceae bacterium]|nr:copper resistance protein CopC [Azospirillaceae bacterium]
MTSRLITATAAFALALGIAGTAAAHAHLKRSVPTASGTVAGSAQVEAWFTEDLEPKFSTITVTGPGPNGKKVDKGDTHTDPSDAKHLLVSINGAAPGTYTVDWAVTSVDTHKSQGSFTFEVQK